MKTSSNYLFLVIVICFLGVPSAFGVDIYNQQGDFEVAVTDQQKVTYNDDIQESFTFTVKNQLDREQQFVAEADSVEGWDILVDPPRFTLDAGESRTVTFSYVANSDFDYTTQVVSPDAVKISQKEDYMGYFDFPVSIQGSDENVSLRFDLAIDKVSEQPVSFNPRFSREAVSPVSPLKFTVTANNLQKPQRVSLMVYLDGRLLEKITDSYSQENNYKIYQVPVTSTYSPGEYNTRIVVRYLQEESKIAQEWYETDVVTVAPYQKLDTQKEKSPAFYGSSTVIELTNEGNVPATYEGSVSSGFIQSLFFHSTVPYQRGNGELRFSETLEPGETVTVSYSFNYVPLYVLLLVVVVLGAYFYVRKASNPLDVEPQIYDIKRVKHEGVKSLKISIGFENIKEEEIEQLRVIFRMPSYLQVEDDSFLITPPKHVLKGRNQYKLIWDFKRLEMNDARIIGFSLINSRGILGDIRIPDVEFEVKVNGKVRRYYESLPLIKG